MSDIPAVRQLEDSLVASIAQDQKRRERQRADRGRAKLAISGVAIVLAAAAIVVVPAVLPADETNGPSGPLNVDSASAQVSVSEEAEAYAIEFANLHADSEAVGEALREHGLAITVDFIAVSPSMVGELVAASDDGSDSARVSYEYRRGEEPSGDVVAARVPLDFRGQMQLTIGRRAEPGEMFESSAVSAMEPGEALHCVSLYDGRTVREILPALDERGVRVTWRDYSNQPVTVDDVLDQYVNSATPYAPGEVLITTIEDDPAPNLSPQYQALLRSGCE